MRRWTAEEANAELPRITAIVERVREVAASARRRAEGIAARAPGNGHATDDDVARAFREAVEALAAEDIVLRDADAGLIDFPAATDDGRPYWLCWVVGEPAVAWWHWPEDGFAGRRPLTDPPE